MFEFRNICIISKIKVETVARICIFCLLVERFGVFYKKGLVLSQYFVQFSMEQEEKRLEQKSLFGYKKTMGCYGSESM